MPKLKLINYKTEEATYWAAQSHDFDATIQDQTGLLGCSRVTVKYGRAVPAPLVDDQVMFGLWVSKVAGNEFSMVPTTELASLETALDTFVNALAGYIANDYILQEYSWHQYNENLPRDKTGRGQKPGPAVRTTSKSIAGTSVATRLPDQVAMNVTFRTASRKHWGRSCLPGFAVGNLTTDYGRWSTTVVDAITVAADTLHNTWQGLGYQLGTWSQLHPAFLTPKQIECDDVPDIQRRRRAKRSGYRKIL